MNRAFKSQFFGSHEDRKTIVTMSVRVDNGKRFRNLSEQDKKDLITTLERFTLSVIEFTEELQEGKYQTK